MTIELKPEVEAGLQAEARAKDTSVEAIIEKLFEPFARQVAVSGEPESKLAALRQWIASHRPTPPLSDEAVSREAIYGDRG